MSMLIRLMPTPSTLVRGFKPSLLSLHAVLVDGYRRRTYELGALAEIPLAGPTGELCRKDAAGRRVAGLRLVGRGNAGPHRRAATRLAALRRRSRWLAGAISGRFAVSAGEPGKRAAALARRVHGRHYLHAPGRASARDRLVGAGERATAQARREDLHRNAASQIALPPEPQGRVFYAEFL